MDLVHRGALEPDRDHALSAGQLTAPARAFLEAIMGEVPGHDDVYLDALTHGSMGEPRNYERLEFLGDRVLGLVIAEWLFESAGDAEGKLSQRLNALVSREMCAGIARDIGLAQHMRLGKQARDDGGADSDNILGDIMEALIGARFVSAGFGPARAMIRSLWAEAVAGKAGKSKHPKSALQEWAAGNKRKVPEYRLVGRAGPDHAASFKVAVAVPGVGEAEAGGASKQDAETAAAAEFMRRFG